MAKRNATKTADVFAPFAAFMALMAPLVKIARTVTPDTFMATLKSTLRDVDVTHARRNVGRITGRRIMDVQNATMITNAHATWQLDDCQLLFVWLCEFPAATGRVFHNPRHGNVSDGIRIVRGVRADWNRTGHGTGIVPAVPAESYGTKRFDFAPSTTDAKPASKKTVASGKPASAKPASKKTVAA